MCRIVTVLLIFLLNISLSAQQYHAAALQQATGIVKSIKVKTKNPLSFNNLKYYKDGKSKFFPWNYDEQGFPTDFKVSVLKKNFNGSVVYDSDSRPVEMLFNNLFMKVAVLTINYEYDESNRISKVTYTFIDDKDTVTVTDSCSTYSFDEKGNWVSREVIEKVTSLNGTKKNSERSFTETREIRYY